MTLRSKSNTMHGLSTLMLLLQTTSPATALVTPSQLQPAVRSASPSSSHAASDAAFARNIQLGAKLPSFDGVWNPKTMTENVFENFSQSKDTFMASMEHKKEELAESMQHQQQKLMADLDLPFHKSGLFMMDDNTDSVLMGGHKPDVLQMAVQYQDSTAPQLFQPSNDPSQLDANVNAAMELVASFDDQADLQATQFESAKAAVLDSKLPSDILDNVINANVNVKNILTTAAKDSAQLQDAGVASISDKVIVTGSVDMMTTPQSMMNNDILIPAIDADVERVGRISTTEAMQALQDVTVNAKQQMSDTVAASKFHFVDSTGTSNTKGFEVKEVGEASIDMLHKLANGMVGSMESVSHNLLNFVEELMKGSKGGFAAPSGLLHTAQESIQKIVNGGIESVMATVNSVGDITIRDMITNLVSLVALVVKVLFQLVSTLVAAASGKGIAAWVDQTNAAIHQGALALQDQAEHFSNDLSHQSLNEMVAMADSYLHASTTYMAETATTVLNMGEVTGSLAAPLVSAIFTEGVSSTWNTLSDKF